ncbi:hypothetical protein OROGR_010864 [Orobanche gracilis]
MAFAMTSANASFVRVMVAVVSSPAGLVVIRGKHGVASIASSFSKFLGDSMSPVPHTVPLDVTKLIGHQEPDTIMRDPTCASPEICKKDAGEGPGGRLPDAQVNLWTNPNSRSLSQLRRVTLRVEQSGSSARQPHWAS